MKRVIASILSIIMLFSLITVNVDIVYAEQNESNLTELIDNNGDLVKIEQIYSYYRQTNSNVYAFDIYKNSIFDHQMYIDWDDNNIIFTYANGEKENKKITDLVRITDIPDRTYDLDTYSITDKIVNAELANSSATSAVDYIDNEPLYVTESGEQSILPNAEVYFGYSAMGYRGGYYYAPGIYGYLQRANRGISESLYAKKFDFTAGTTVSAAVGIIVAAFSSTGIGLAIGIATTLLSAVIGSVVDSYSVTYQVDVFKLAYRVRLNSNTGQDIYSTTRTKSYWKAYSPTTGKLNYQYRGNGYDGGFALSNSDMIKAAIDGYIQ